MPGRWRTDRIAAAKGPMLAVTDPTVYRITIMGPTQLLKTEFINNVVGFKMHQEPGPMIVMQPTQGMAEAWSKDRLDKMIRDTPVLNELVKSKKTRDSDNTIFHKSFPGGHISTIWPSPSQLASRPVPFTLRDEIDKYEDTTEGDPSSLIFERSATFWNRLDIGVCSPTIKGHSKIEKEYLASDRRKFHVDCPHCGHNHFMEWKYVKWFNNDANTAQYECPECLVLWSEKDRLEAIRLAGEKPDGGYVATAPFKGHAGFHMNKLASPWEPLSALVQKWIDSQSDVQKLKTFINTQLAETWEEKGEAPEYMRLYERRSLYKINTIPKGVLFLTCGVDVQKDRLELEIVGWGRGKKSWSIDYRVIMGDTASDKPWLELDKVLNESWEIGNGLSIGIRVLAIDSGFNTQYVYNWARKYPSNKVLVVKGHEAQQNILGIPQATDVSSSGEKIKRGVRVWPVGVSNLKSELYGFLNLNGAGDDGVYPPGFCFFPQYDENYFKGLCSEQLHKTIVNGKTVYRWKKSYERNEPLDTRNYARAGAAFVGIDRFKESDWLDLEELFLQPTEPPPTPSDTKSENSFWSRQNGRKLF